MQENCAFPIPPSANKSGNLRCPHCKMSGIRRSSVEVAITHRELFFACANPFCGHSWKATLAYEYGISPSAIPNPDMAHLTLRPPSRAEVMAALRASQAGDMPEDDANQLDMFAGIFA